MPTVNLSQFKTGDLLIDVSHHNGIINWKTVKTTNIKGVILRSSQGSSVKDRQFERNVLACAELKIPFGVYHFCTWNAPTKPVQDAIEEANFCIQVINKIGATPTLPVFADTESNTPIPYTKKSMVAYVSAFTKAIQDAGFTPGIYGSPGFLNQYYPTDHPFTTMPLWVADYTGPVNPIPGWKKAWMRQYTDTGKVSGIQTAVDLNVIL